MSGVTCSSAVCSWSSALSRKPPATSAALRRLLPVVVAVPGVVRAGEQAPIQRLGHEHLAARRHDGRVELREQALRVAVGGEHDVVGLELVDRLDALVLAQLGACLGGSRRQPAHPAGRLKRPIRRMEDRAVEPAPERLRQLVAPLDLEAVLTESLVLGLELGPLGRIGRQPEASGAPEGVARQLLEPVEIALGPAPEPLGLLGSEVAPRLVVGRRAAAEREAAVAPARAAGDLARLVEANAPPRLREHERAGAAGHPAAHDRHVHRPRRPAREAREGSRALRRASRSSSRCRRS